MNPYEAPIPKFTSWMLYHGMVTTQEKFLIEYKVPIEFNRLITELGFMVASNSLFHSIQGALNSQNRIYLGSSPKIILLHTARRDRKTNLWVALAVILLWFEPVVFSHFLVVGHQHGHVINHDWSTLRLHLRFVLSLVNWHMTRRFAFRWPWRDRPVEWCTITGLRLTDEKENKIVREAINSGHSYQTTSHWLLVWLSNSIITC